MELPLFPGAYRSIRGNCFGFGLLNGCLGCSLPNGLASRIAVAANVDERHRASPTDGLGDIVNAPGILAVIV